jgi:hypothetical protein
MEQEYKEKRRGRTRGRRKEDKKRIGAGDNDKRE